jgi:transposase-like protein
MGKSKSRFTLVEKEEIVRVAFSSPRNVKATARLYGIAPQNIRYWAKSFLVARSTLSPSAFKKLKSRLSLSQGRSANKYECDNALFEFMQNLCQQQHKVTVRLICAEYKRINVDNSEVSNYSFSDAFTGGCGGGKCLCNVLLIRHKTWCIMLK